MFSGPNRAAGVNENPRKHHALTWYNRKLQTL
jgi:hypothetical protein